MEKRDDFGVIEADDAKVVELPTEDGALVPPLTQFDRYKERVANVMETVAAAFRSGRMLVAIFSVQDGQLQLTRHTHDFPPDDFEAATNLLRDDLARELGAAERKSPLPRASVVRPKPMDLMFGRAIQKPNSIEE